MNEDLANGRLDASLLASVSASEFFKTPGGKDFAFIGAELTDSKYFGVGDGIGVRKDDTALLNAFNAALQAIRANGTYKKINDRYFDFDMRRGAVTSVPRRSPADRRMGRRLRPPNA